MKKMKAIKVALREDLSESNQTIFNKVVTEMRKTLRGKEKELKQVDRYVLWLFGNPDETPDSIEKKSLLSQEDLCEEMAAWSKNWVYSKDKIMSLIVCAGLSSEDAEDVEILLGKAIGEALTLEEERAEQERLDRERRKADRAANRKSA